MVLVPANMSCSANMVPANSHYVPRV